MLSLFGRWVGWGLKQLTFIPGTAVITKSPFPLLDNKESMFNIDICMILTPTITLPGQWMSLEAATLAFPPLAVSVLLITLPLMSGKRALNSTKAASFS